MRLSSSKEMRCSLNAAAYVAERQSALSGENAFRLSSDTMRHARNVAGTSSPVRQQACRNIDEEYRQAQRKGARQMKLRRFTSAGVEMARQYLAAVKESNGVENVTLNGQPFTCAAKLTHFLFSSCANLSPF